MRVKMLILFFFILSVEVLDIGRKNNRFGMAIHKLITNEEPLNNVVFSPYSIYSVLGVLLGACDGESRSQLLEALQISEYDTIEDELHFSLSNLARSIDQAECTNIAHAVFINEQFSIYPSFVDFAKSNYDAYVETKKFPRPGTQEINDWIAIETKDRIKNFFREELSSSTMSVLLNTIHFKNSWRTPFKKYMTKPHQFALINENEIQGSSSTMMMEDTRYVFYGEHDWYGSKFQSIDLNFKSNEEEESQFGMIFLLPSCNRLSELKKLEKMIQKTETEGHINPITRIIDEQDFQNVHIKLPRFEIEWRMKINELLKDLGAIDIFDPLKADLSKLSDVNGLFVSEVIHQANIKVDEDGCEAAAATAVLILKKSAFPLHENTHFHAHKPFMYILYHKMSKTILFMGKVMEPEESEDEIVVWIGDDDERERWSQEKSIESRHEGLVGPIIGISFGIGSMIVLFLFILYLGVKTISFIREGNDHQSSGDVSCADEDLSSSYDTLESFLSSETETSDNE